MAQANGIRIFLRIANKRNYGERDSGNTGSGIEEAS